MSKKPHRYQQLADALEISVREMEKECSLTQGRIGTSIYRDSNIKGEIVDAITTRYPNVNRTWLETGQGDMFSTPTDTFNEPPADYGAPADKKGFFAWLLRQHDEYIKSRPVFTAEELETMARQRRKIEELKNKLDESE